MEPPFIELRCSVIMRLDSVAARHSRRTERGDLEKCPAADCFVVAMNDGGQSYGYPQTVRFDPDACFYDLALLRVESEIRALPADWRSGLDERFEAEFGAALLAFNGEAVVYCKGISDVVAQEYATQYARMLENRVKGIDARLPPIRSGLFEPNRNLIRSILDNLLKKHFPQK